MANFALFIAAFLVFLPPISASPNRLDAKNLSEDTESQKASEILVKIGVKADGTPNSLWLDALRSRRTSAEIAEVRNTSRPFTSSEIRWLKEFQEYLPTWEKQIHRLVLPFEQAAAPATTTLLFGNQGSIQPGFIGTRSTIVIDLSKWIVKAGQPRGKTEDEDSIRDFLSEQYIRLIATQWGESRFPVKTALERTLWDIYLDGLSQHKFLSKKFLPYKGHLPQVSKDNLNKLTPILVENLSKLRNAEADDEMSIRVSLANTKLEDNWGTFPVTFWLALETGGDDKKLKPWINEGPLGILQLMKKHIPQEMKPRVERLIHASKSKH